MGGLVNVVTGGVNAVVDVNTFEDVPDMGKVVKVKGANVPVILLDSSGENATSGLFGGTV